MEQTQPQIAADGAPAFRPVSTSMLMDALRKGWRDFRAVPKFGLFFASVYSVIGLLLWQLTQWTGQGYWLLLAAFGFPLIGPFAAVGLYKVSAILEAGERPGWRRVLTDVWREKDRQIPSMSAIIILLFIIWIFIGHVIFALFMGLSVMTNISTSYQVFLTPVGLSMLLAELVIGGAVAFLLFAITVVGMPMLVDREVDFVTAMIASFSMVLQNPGPMIGWAIFVAALLTIGMFPYFLGLLVVLPVLGHATWHLYRSAIA